MDRFERLAKWSGMPLVTGKTHTFMNFLPSNGTKEAYDIARAFVFGEPEHHFLAFAGQPGSEKVLGPWRTWTKYRTKNGGFLPNVFAEQTSEDRSMARYRRNRDLRIARIKNIFTRKEKAKLWNNYRKSKNNHIRMVPTDYGHRHHGHYSVEAKYQYKGN